MNPRLLPECAEFRHRIDDTDTVPVEFRQPEIFLVKNYHAESSHHGAKDIGKTFFAEGKVVIGIRHAPDRLPAFNGLIFQHCFIINIINGAIVRRRGNRERGIAPLVNCCLINQLLFGCKQSIGKTETEDDEASIFPDMCRNLESAGYHQLNDRSGPFYIGNFPENKFPNFIFILNDIT